MGLTAVVPAGGLGTRLYPLSRAVPKALLPVGAVPAIERCLTELATAGFTRALVITASPVSRAVGAYLAGRPERSRLAVHVVDVPWQPGIGAVLTAARRELGEVPFALALPDEIVADARQVWGSLAHAARRHRASAVTVLDDRERFRPVFRLGRVDGPASAERADASTPRMIGRFLLRPDVHAVAEEQRHAELTVPGLIGRLAERGTAVGVTYRGLYHDIGSMTGYLRAAAEFATESLTVAQDGEASAASAARS